MTQPEELKKYTKVYDGEFVEIYDLSPEIPHTAFAFWKGFFSLKDEKFIKEMNVSLNYIKKTEHKILISDHSFLKVVKDDVLKWIHENWYTTALENGLLFELSISPDCIFGNLSLEKILDQQKSKNIIIEKVQNFEDGKRAAKLFIDAHYL